MVLKKLLKSFQCASRMADCCHSFWAFQTNYIDLQAVYILS